METNLQKCAIRREVQSKHSGSGGRGGRGRSSGGGGGGCWSALVEGPPRRRARAREEREGEGKGGRSLSQAVLPPAHNHVAKSTRGDSADYLRGSTRRGPATPLQPCPPDRCGRSRPVIAGPPRTPRTMDSLTRARRD